MMIIQDSLLSTLSETAQKYGLTAKRSLRHERVVNIVIDSKGTYIAVEKGEAMVSRGVFAGNDVTHARFLVERSKKALLLSPKYASQHMIFKKQIEEAASANPKSKSGTVVKFFKKLNATKQKHIHKEICDLCGKNADPLVTFVEYNRKGNIPCFDKFAQTWWKKEYKHQLQKRFASCFQGICQITGKNQIIPNCSPMPIGKAGALMSANWKAAEYGGYNGLESSHIGIDAAIDIALAIEHIYANLLKYRGKYLRTSFRIDKPPHDKHYILSWFCNPVINENDTIVLEQSFYGHSKEEWETQSEKQQEPLSYIDWIRAQYYKSKHVHFPSDDNIFCTLLVAKNPGEARLVILEQAFLTIPKLRQNILQWHDDLDIESTYRKKSGAVIRRPSMSVKKAMRVLFDNPGKSAIPSHICRTIHSAFFHGHDIRGQHLHRLNSRIIKAMITQRYFWDLLSLLKLCLIRKGINMPKTWAREKAESSPAYAIGSILFLTAYAQSPRSKGRESIIPNKYLTWCAGNPARSFFAFSKMFEIYLTRLRRESPGLVWWLQRARDSLLSSVGDLPSSLSPTEKSELLLGFGLMREALQTQNLKEIFSHLKKEKEKNHD